MCYLTVNVIILQSFSGFLKSRILMGPGHDAIFKLIHSHVLLESILDKRVPLHCTDVLR